jgi:tripartite-type tricarboxylate transporter receptor subunit TctC
MKDLLMITRRRLAALAGSLAVAPLYGASTSSAQAWPAKPVRLIVPFAAGGANDPIARLVTSRLSEIWGQPVVIENKPGAGGSIGAEFVARSEPDGYTILLMGEVPFAVNQFLYPTKHYDPLGDFAPAVRIVLSPNVMVVPNSSPAKTVTEFIAHAKSRAGKVNFASSGTGTSVHLSGELFKRMTGIEMTHIPYRGGAPALTDIIAGRVDVMFGVSGVTLPHVQSGVMRGLGVTTLRRLPQASALPTVAEAGVPGFDVSAPFAFYLPAATPPDIIKKINADTVAVLHEPAVKSKLEGLGLLVESSTPEGLRAQLKSEADRWGSVIKDAKIKAAD